MRTPLLILLATLPLASAQPTGASPGEALIRRWRSVETSKGGIGAVYQFHADGTIDFSPSAIVDMPYRVDGDELILPLATATRREIVSTLAWPSNDVLRMSVQGQT